jgi:hypothetical protein
MELLYNVKVTDVWRVCIKTEMCRRDRQCGCGPDCLVCLGDTVLFTSTVSECLLSVLVFYWIPSDVTTLSYQTN